MTDARAALQTELGKVPVPPLDSLSPEQLAHLAEAIAHAREGQHDALHAAMEAGLMSVPKLLRGTVRKVLFA